MNRVPVKFAKIKPPSGLTKLFVDLPLVGNESREEYECVFAAIASAANPADAIAWLYVRDIRMLKVQVINSYHKRTVHDLLTPPWLHDDNYNFSFAPRVHPDAEKINREMEKWSSDAKARRRIETELANDGYDEAYILTRA